MPVLGINPITSIIDTRTPFDIKEKEQPQPKLHAVPVAASYFTEEKLQSALEKAVETLSISSETTAVSESETSSLYSSAQNGASLDESRQSASHTASVASFFSSSFGKIQSQAQSTFPKGYAFLEKVFNQKGPTAKDAFAIFDGICSSLDKQEYKNLPDFAGLCEKAPELETHLEELKNSLNLIEDDFKKASIYQMPSDVSGKEYQSWLDQRSKVETGLASLGPATKSLDIIIGSLKSQLLSEEQSFSVRILTGMLTGLGYVATACGFPGVVLFAGSLATNLGFETKQFLSKQKIKEWETFKKPLDELINKNPLSEDEVFINRMMANANAANLSHTGAIQGTQDAIKALQEQTIKALEVKADEALKRAETAEKIAAENNQKLGIMETKLDAMTNLMQMILERQEKNVVISSKA